MKEEKNPSGGKRKKRRWPLYMCAALAVYLCVDFYLSNHILQLSRLNIALDRLPPGFDGFKVVHLSDWHAAAFGPDNLDLIEMVRQEQPDIIALTGDFVEKAEDLPGMEILCRALAGIAPTYYVTGNHEWGGRIVSLLLPVLGAAGVTYLDNDYVFLERNGETLCLIGIGDLNGRRDQPKLTEVVAAARRFGNPFFIMLSHRYDRFEEYVAEGVDLVLSGHAHGGLVRLPFTDGLLGPGRVLFPKHTSGVAREGNTAMATSRGMGFSSDTPVRLFNRPEVVSITLRTTP